MVTTPLRSGVHEVRDGVRLLRPNPDIPYRDGAEDRLWEIVSSTTDLGSDSTEMLELASGWAEEYHTHPARANVLRALDIPANATILEIGSGCGPITRYLGEVGAQVDSLEPVFVRARVARSRTRDLQNVEVFCGNLEEVPLDPVYDIIVVVGVLEYVGAGKPDLEPYLRFLQECRTRLAPGGSLVLAIENRLGVKYLTGTGEDHSGRIFHSVEGYPRLGPAYTFSASALRDLVSTTGFSSTRLFGVFPDYKHTRVVFDTDALYTAAPELLVNLPSFPSRYAGTRRVKLASEERVWSELVHDGLALHFVNSFLVLGSTDAAEALWPDDRLAKYFSVNRRREYAAITDVRQLDGVIRLDRVYNPERGQLIADGVESWDYVRGPSFLEVFEVSDQAGRRDLLRRWIELVRAAASHGTVPLDAIPSNVIVSGGGELELIDSEFHDDVSTDHVIDRGLFWLAIHLGRTTPPEMWSPARTISDVWAQLVELADRRLDEASIDRLLTQESAFQVAVTTNHLGPEAVDEAKVTLRRSFDTNLGDTTLGRRLHHQYDDAVAARDALQRSLDSSQDEVAELRQQVSELRAAVRTSRSQAKRARRVLRDLQRSRTYRLVDTVRRGARKVVPRR